MPKVLIPIIDNTKQCSKCKEWKGFDLFRVHLSNQTGYRSQCKKCEQIRKRYPYNKGSYGYKKSTTLNSPYKILVLSHYGNECFCCGEDNISLLSVDHINDNGKEHGTGKLHGRYKGITLYRFLVKNNYPSGIQIACFNCNIGRRINSGICPHKR